MTLVFCDWIEECAKQYEAVIPAGKRIVLPYTWGYDENNKMTKPKDVVINLQRQCTVREAWRKLYRKYAKTVAQPRDYYAENVRMTQWVSANDTVTFDWGS